ncbi:hypothetical protein OIU91_16780 [Streptomyces sp. NBC_01456]|uniref:hypothetical protein n=1 Tax=Streptomyces sp. NBC_01456 TaxID=2975868 RepID=UPI002E321B20|nr:hypothetical protein [Streptomyces sp. NBC_01456]
MTPTPDSLVHELPAGVPSVHLTGRFIAPDGTPLTGTLTFAPPMVLTMPDADTIANTVATVEITKADQGSFEINLIATDAPGMSPRGWTYLVTEKLKGAQIRQYHIMLPERPGGDPVDLADLAPASPYSGRYLPVVGPTGATGAQGLPGEVRRAELEALEERLAPRPVTWSQGSASALWTIDHAFPYLPAVRTYDTSGREIGGLVGCLDPYTVTVQFAFAETGSAILS